MSNPLYKDGFLYLSHDHDWELEKYGYDTLSKWDCIFITMRKIIDDNDTSYWALMSINHSSWLLQCGVRWPDKLNDPRDAGIEGFDPYGKQTKLTRDPFWYVLVAECLLRKTKNHARALKLPARIWIPSYYFFRMFLITEKKKWLWLYRRVTFKSKLDYVQQMHKYRDMAIDKILSK